MKYTQAKVITTYDLRDAIEAQYDVYIENIAELLCGTYYNDSYQKIYIKDEGWMQDLRIEESQDATETLLMLTFLADSFPEDEYILLDTSW